MEETIYDVYRPQAVLVTLRWSQRAALNLTVSISKHSGWQQRQILLQINFSSALFQCQSKFDVVLKQQQMEQKLAHCHNSLLVYLNI